MVSVRYLSALGPRWCKWIGAILSRLSALLFLVSLIASFIVFHCISLIFLFFISLGRIVFSSLYLFALFIGSWREVVFLASKYLAHCSGGLTLLDEIPFTVLQILEQLPFGEH